MEDARIRMVSDENYSKDNFVVVIVKIIQKYGLFSSFSGLPAMLAKQVPYTMAKQVSFDLFAKHLYVIAAKLNWHHPNLQFGITLLSAFLSSILSCIFSQPGDVLLTASSHSSSDSKKGFVETIQQIYNRDGLKGFYLGIRARLVHVALIITFQLVIYDMVKQLLGLAATGSH